jgi:hypothetical protein
MRGVPKRYSGKGPVRTNRIAASHVASPVQTVEDCAECGGVKCVEWSYLVSSVATELLFASWRCLLYPRRAPHGPGRFRESITTVLCVVHCEHWANMTRT